jgi:endonuclease G
VTAGPIFDARPATLSGGEAIPSAFFTLVLRRELGQFAGLAFVMPNGDASGELLRFQTSIRRVEELTNLVFDTTLAPDAQDHLELPVAAPLWTLPETRSIPSAPGRP